LDNLYWLDQIQPANRRFVGDQAFYLGLLTQRSYPVMPGFVVSTIAFQQFLETIDWLEPLFADLPSSSLHLDVDNPRQLQAIAQQIRRAIQAAPLPQDWVAHLTTLAQTWQVSTLILQPSLTLQSGLEPTLSSRTLRLLETQVCLVEAAAIAHSLKQLWAELFRAKSLLYWQRLGISLQQVHLAVLVQPLGVAIASGDVQVRENHLEVRAVWGSGQALIDGGVMPDVYFVNTQTGLVQQQVGSKTYAEASAPTAWLPTSTGSPPHFIEPDQQHVLQPNQLQELIQLSQQVALDLSPRLHLEWTIASTHAEPTLWLTQATPQLTIFLPDRLPAPNTDKSPADLLPIAPIEDYSSIVSPTASSPYRPKTLLTTGQAAATGRLVARAWVIPQAGFPEPLLHPLPAEDSAEIILVTSNITPDWLSYVKQASGLITEQGGMTSHGALVARELGIPAVVGAANATQLIQTGDIVLLDGDRGEVYCVTKGSDAAAPQPRMMTTPVPFTLPLAVSARFDRPNATQLMVNLSQLDSLTQVADLPIDGVGLLRSELMLMELLAQYPELEGDRTVLIDRLAARISQFAQAFTPRPVFYRSLDLRSHEYRSLNLFKTAETQRPVSELHPILGLHGTFSYQTDPTLFQAELAALRQVQQSGNANIHLILPFVRTVEEFSFCQKQVRQAELTQNPHFQLWIMAEVPSVLFLLPDYVKAGVQGISIGSNDLTQLLLGVDRDQPQMAAAYDQRHPAVLRAIRSLIAIARQENIPCSICGEAPSQYPELVAELVRWGITSISVGLPALEHTHRAIARAEQMLLLEAARQNHPS
jgi:pyruvate, water dikinase